MDVVVICGGGVAGVGPRSCSVDYDIFIVV